MPRLTIVLAAAVLFTAHFANCHSVAVPEHDAMASSQSYHVSEMMPEPETSKDDAVTSSQGDDVVKITDQPHTSEDDAVASDQVVNVALNSPEASTPVAEYTSSQSNKATPQENEFSFQISLGTSTESSPTPVSKANAQSLKIDGTIEKVQNRSAQIFAKIMDMGLQGVRAKLDLLEPYKEKLGTYVQTLKSYVIGIIAARRIEGFHKHDCQQSFDNYAISLISNTLSKIEEAFVDAYHAMSISFGNFSVETKTTINRLLDLKNMTLMSDDETEHFAEQISAIYEAYESSADTFRDDFMLKADGPRIIEEMRPVVDYNINLGLAVIEKTYKCVFDII